MNMRLDCRWEIDNRYWETEDLLVLKSGTKAEIIWRSPDWIQEQLERTLDRCEASIGYSTCFWANFLSSQILFDRDGKMSALQKNYDRPFPELLRVNIISKNRPILAEKKWSTRMPELCATLPLDWASDLDRLLKSAYSGGGAEAMRQMTGNLDRVLAEEGLA